MGGTSSSEKESEPTKYRNLQFYRNEIKSSIWYGYKIEEMLAWRGQYSKLESKHDYIQWLFPIPDSRGMNYSAQPLLEEEAQAIREDVITRARVVAAYDMMLDFYGMFLHDEETGIVLRGRNYKERYENLNSSTHNFRRISRIIKSLGELGYKRFQVRWITFLLEEIFVHKLLPRLNGGCIQHWIDAIKDQEERSQMYRNLDNLTDGGKPTSSTQTISSVIDDGIKTESVDVNTHHEDTKVDETSGPHVYGPDLSTNFSGESSDESNEIDGRPGNIDISLMSETKRGLNMTEMTVITCSDNTINNAGDNCDTSVKTNTHINDHSGILREESDNTDTQSADKNCENGCDDHCANSNRTIENVRYTSNEMKSPSTVLEDECFYIGETSVPLGLDLLKPDADSDTTALFVATIGDNSLGAHSIDTSTDQILHFDGRDKTGKQDLDKACPPFHDTKMHRF